jgi:carotenoid 1,2-hydratase
MERPGLSWFGTGYLDSNEGDRPLERDFKEWDWCRAPTKEGAIILYNAARRVGGRQDLALRIDGAGAIEEFTPPPRAPLPRTLWGLHPSTRCDAHSQPFVRQRLEDAPFYSRSVIETRLLGERLHAVHESLVMDRFTAPWVQAMLPFRIPRAG